MMERAKALEAFLKEASEPVIWGHSDCCAWPAAWIERTTGRAIARPAYRTKAEAAALIAAAGGLVELLTPLMQAAGFSPCFGDEALGDVGVMRISRGAVGIIFCGYGVVAWRREEGGALLMAPRRETILASWSV